MQQILHVDDNEGDVAIWSEAWTESGIQDIEVVCLRTGDELWTWLNAEPKAPALILTDQRLPDITGVELALRLRSAPLLAHVPLVIISGSVAQPHTADDWIVKPDAFDEMVKLVRFLDKRFLKRCFQNNHA